jgi:hypothetical protein
LPTPHTVRLSAVDNRYVSRETITAAMASAEIVLILENDMGDISVEESIYRGAGFEVHRADQGRTLDEVLANIRSLPKPPVALVAQNSLISREVLDATPSVRVVGR